MLQCLLLLKVYQQPEWMIPPACACYWYCRQVCISGWSCMSAMKSVKAEPLSVWMSVVKTMLAGCTFFPFFPLFFSAFCGDHTLRNTTQTPLQPPTMKEPLAVTSVLCDLLSEAKRLSFSLLELWKEMRIRADECHFCKVFLATCFYIKLRKSQGMFSFDLLSIRPVLVPFFVRKLNVNLNGSSA